MKVIEEMGSPFLEESSDLLRIDTKDIADIEAVKSMRDTHDVGKYQFDKFVKDRLHDRSTPLNDTLHKNKIMIFKPRSVKTQVPKTSQVKSLKNECALFAQLYISSQARHGNMDEFFKHENQPYPPSLSQGGSLRATSKSVLLSCFEKVATSQKNQPKCDVLIIDGATVVHMLKPDNIQCQTVGDYAQKMFVPYIEQQLTHHERVDIVWDEYRTNSLKQPTRQRRGKGVRRRVEAGTKIPGNWQDFLRLDENKKELFVFLAEYIPDLSTEKEVVSKYGDSALSRGVDIQGVAPCNHEEADTKMMVHIKNASDL